VSLTGGNGFASDSFRRCAQYQSRILRRIKQAHRLGRNHNFRRPYNLHLDHKRNVRHNYNPCYSLPHPQVQLLVRTVPCPPQRWQYPRPRLPLPSHFVQSLVTAWHCFPLIVVNHSNRI